MEYTRLPLSFSARDLLARLVRSEATIRCDLTTPAGAVWFCCPGCFEVALESVVVNELLQAGLIESQDTQRYRASAQGKKLAGRDAAADAARSAKGY